MTFWSRKSGPVDRITAQALADFGRFELLKEQSGIDPSAAFALISPLNESIYTSRPEDRAAVIAELHRHAESGEWEKVGAWKYVREMLTDEPDTRSLIDGGLLAVDRMRVTNLAIHMAPIDLPRYEELVGHPPNNDGFFGPPVFDSKFGPSRQYYFDDAIAHAACRRVARIPSSPGVEPGPVEEAARKMWDFGLLVHRGPLVVSPDISFEPNVVRPAIAAATGVDHERFAELVVEELLDKSSHICGVWSTLGAARFFEEYLDPSVAGGPAHTRVLDEGVTLAFESGLINVAFPVNVLTPLQHAAFEARERRGAAGPSR
jgi:hypothetical protein